MPAGEERTRRSGVAGDGKGIEGRQREHPVDVEGVMPAGRECVESWESNKLKGGTKTPRLAWPRR
jgi:hypothetical protein